MVTIRVHLAHQVVLEVLEDPEDLVVLVVLEVLEGGTTPVKVNIYLSC